VAGASQAQSTIDGSTFTSDAARGGAGGAGGLITDGSSGIVGGAGGDAYGGAIQADANLKITDTLFGGTGNGNLATGGKGGDGGAGGSAYGGAIAQTAAISSVTRSKPSTTRRPVAPVGRSTTVALAAPAAMGSAAVSSSEARPSWASRTARSSSARRSPATADRGVCSASGGPVAREEAAESTCPHRDPRSTGGRRSR
jgi:hypothetical protein